jgi:[ribosomal protein S5]-alanine N-acetyltransferase
MDNTSFAASANLYTERLVLRQMTMNDAPQILVLRSDERILQYLLISKCLNEEEAMQFIDKINKSVSRSESYYWVGTICIWNISEENSRAEIGFVLHPDWQGMGLMNEAVKTVLDFVFDKLRIHSIEAEVHPGNLASKKLLKKQGFVKDASSKENIFSNDGSPATELYSLISPHK